MDDHTPGEGGAPKSKRRWLLFAGIAVVGVVAVALGIGFVCELRETTVGDVERQLKSNIPVGSTQAEISAYLDSEGIGYSDTHRAGEFSVLSDEGVPADKLVVFAIIPDNAVEVIVTCDIEVFLILDDAQRLESYYVRKGCTGP